MRQVICQLIKVQHNNKVAEFVNYIKYLNLPVVSTIFKTVLYIHILYFTVIIYYAYCYYTVVISAFRSLTVNLSAESTNSSLYWKHCGVEY